MKILGEQILVRWVSRVLPDTTTGRHNGNYGANDTALQANLPSFLTSVTPIRHQIGKLSAAVSLLLCQLSPHKLYNLSAAIIAAALATFIFCAVRVFRSEQ
jgi:hypothetical protein